MAVQSTLETMVRELDRREVFFEGREWILTAYWDPSTDKPFVCWRLKDRLQDDAQLVEVEPNEVIKILRHPTLFVPQVAQT